MLKTLVGLESELEHRSALQRDVAEQGRGRRCDTRGPSMMLRPECRRCRSRGTAKCRDVEPAFDHLLDRTVVIELRVADEIGAIVGEAVEVGDRSRRRW
jgi:hypothetical protein